MAPPRRAASAITSYFEVAPTSAKRKAAAVSEDLGDSEKENINNKSEDDVSPPKKKSKAKGTTKTTAKSPKKDATKSKPKGPTPKKLYNDTIKKVASEVKALDKKVKTMHCNSVPLPIDVGTYADNAWGHVKVVNKVAATDHLLAFNLLLCLGDAACPDLSHSMRFSGYGDHETPYAEMDEALLPLIEARKVPAIATSLPKVRHRWTRKDADVGEIKTGNGPNRQQRNEMANQRVEWEEERREERRKRRGECEGWLSIALSDLKEERDHLDPCGIEGFFTKGIAKLEALDAARK